jgi:hypothetical protein
MDNLYDKLAVMAIIRALPHFPTPLMMLYTPSLSWTSLTSSLSSKHLETWTRHVAICLEHLQHFMQPQLLKRCHKGHLGCHPCLHHSLYHPHYPLLHRVRAVALNVTSALTLVTLRPSAVITRLEGPLSHRGPRGLQRRK